MATVSRRAYNYFDAISRRQQLVAANDLDGTAATRRAIFVDGGSRVIVFQDNDGTAGTAGVDVVAISYDGVAWAPEPNTGLALDSDDVTGTALAGGVLNAAGVEPTTVKASLFKFGPFEAPCYLRICRKTGTLAGAVTWVTGSPSVLAFLIGPNGGGVPATVTHTAD
jgi:hypothetical protein